MRNAVTKELAELLGLQETDVAMLLGGDWKPAEVPFSPAPELVAEPEAVFVLGEPVQLVAVRLLDGLQWTVGVARHEWATQMPVLVMTSETAITSADDLPLEVAKLRPALEERRLSFSYCDVCYRLTAPEDLDESGVCQSCASDWFGVVY